MGPPPAAASNFGSDEPRPIASITRSPASRARALAGVGAHGGDVDAPLQEAGLERGGADAAAVSTPGSASAARETTHSIVLRRDV